MSLHNAIAKMQRAVPPVPEGWNHVEPPQAAPNKEVPPVPPINSKSETDFSLDADQPGNDIDPANDATGRKWDYQRGWWQGEDGPIWVECWTPAGRRMTVAANDQAHAERIRRDNPPPFGGVA